MIGPKFFNNYTYLILIFAFPFLLFVGCKDTVAGSEDIDKVIIPSSNVSFSQYINPVFNVKCATAGCHDDGTRAGGLSLTSYGNATIDPSIISPGNPSTSKLVWVIEGQIVHPYFIRPLTPNQIQGIKTWILEGANPN